ncbi:uncharacterized protein GLRG_02329 [Colletotrichum graminicola M1.001]|uniref:Uncharacterized protein n=1 Tax=Colletotrichum graminicola (strain M1.001 / M2 / FGSC 10212) TaxID=645133 RepID=E3Q8E6_COLGM|nr:uncharacterized protein GLRG_02329 [Colletotrichum graminicola M1.001]EFQ27158.1 hypothetical protein GLRG_02329 [Colletotrichum graminicola M1.001]
MKGSANLPLPPLRVHEAPRAGNKASVNMQVSWFLAYSPSRLPASRRRRPAGHPYFQGTKRVNRTREGGASLRVPSLSVLGSLCLRAAYTNSRRSRTRAAVSEVDLVQGSTGEARPRKLFDLGRPWPGRS